MKSAIASIAVAAAGLPVVLAGTLELGIIKRQIVKADQQFTRRNSASTAISLFEQKVYTVALNIGTPKQTLHLEIDTGSADLWVPSATGALCDPGQNKCRAGTFKSQDSKSFNPISTNSFNITYGDNSGVFGDVFSDSVDFGGVSVENVTMGLAQTGSVGTGILGLSYQANQAMLPKTQTFVEALVAKGVIPTPAYSVFLNARNTTDGTLLFGGVNRALYDGPLVSLPIVTDAGKPDEVRKHLTVALTSIMVTSSSGTDVLTPSSFAGRAILDTGAEISFLPSDIAAAIYAEVGISSNNPNSPPSLPSCALMQKNATITVGLGGSDGASIAVPIREFVRIQDGVCFMMVLPIGPTSANTILFGDSFLRATYFVADLANNRLAIARAKVNNTAPDDIVEFASLSAAIPGATTAAGEANVSPSLITGSPLVSATQTLNAKSGLTSASAGLTTPFLGTAVLAAALMVVNGAIFFIFV